MTHPLGANGTRGNVASRLVACLKSLPLSGSSGSDAPALSIKRWAALPTMADYGNRAFWSGERTPLGDKKKTENSQYDDDTVTALTDGTWLDVIFYIIVWYFKLYCSWKHKTGLGVLRFIAGGDFGGGGESGMGQQVRSKQVTHLSALRIREHWVRFGLLWRKEAEVRGLTVYKLQYSGWYVLLLNMAMIEPVFTERGRLINTAKLKWFPTVLLAKFPCLLNISSSFMSLINRICWALVRKALLLKSMEVQRIHQILKTGQRCVQNMTEHA